MKNKDRFSGLYFFWLTAFGKDVVATNVGD